MEELEEFIATTIASLITALVRLTYLAAVLGVVYVFTIKIIPYLKDLT